ncbi:MAG: patatin-like phospholipase family protein [Paracoccaceae bacterium]
MRKPKIGLALGSGGARGWAHIGVLRALEERGLKPDVVCGCSMGALVGAAYVSGNLDALEDWARSITTAKLAMMVDVSLNSGGLVEAKQVAKFFETLNMPEMIEDLPIPFLTIATDMRTGREVWLKEGPVIPAVRASISLPGIISPLEVNGRWLLDGGLTNPLPVSACRALGADIVIAVNPEAKRLNVMWKEPPSRADETWDAIRAGLPSYVRGIVDVITRRRKKAHRPPNYFDVVSTSIDVMVDQVRRSRLIGEPPHVLLDVHLEDFSVLDLNRAAAAIAEGRACVDRAQAMLDEVLSG